MWHVIWILIFLFYYVQTPTLETYYKMQNNHFLADFQSFLSNRYQTSFEPSVMLIYKAQPAILTGETQGGVKNVLLRGSTLTGTAMQKEEAAILTPFGSPP